MHGMTSVYAFAAMAAALLVPAAACAQRASDNAVIDADDAFGTNVGLESTGIYSEYDTRGFSPLKAGNVRIDGVYFDPVAPLSGRLRESTAIRVGFGAVNFPFVAPTGIVEHRFRPFADELGLSLGATRYTFGGQILESDVRLPVVKGHVTLTGGLAYADTRQTDGADSRSWGAAFRPIIKVGGVEVAPFISVAEFYHAETRPLIVVREGHLPKIQRKRRYLGQKWAVAKSDNSLYGVTLKAPLTSAISLRAGVFHGVGDRVKNFTEIYSIRSSSGDADHALVADPRQDLHSTSGEALVTLRFGGDRWQHRIFAGFRARNRYTETGGSDFRSFGSVQFGEPDPQDEPDFVYSAVNAGRVRQSSWMLGYIGGVEGVAHLNLGIQKARYRATLRDGGTGITDSSRADPWLYNATLAVDVSPAISLYAGTQRGLEDSGLAPENALNRNEQLPATKTTQYEGGVRLKFGNGQFVLNAFQITKPYFSFDNSQNPGSDTKPFVELGAERHRGVEASLSSHFGKRFNLLAGAVLMKPQVIGQARRLGLVGKRPAGTPSIFMRVDANYRTDIFGGLTPTAGLVYTGKRAAGSSPLASLGNKQLMIGGFVTADLGLRQRFTMGGVDFSFRAVVQNVFDKATWKVVAANVLYPEERRRMIATLAADF